MNNLLIAFPEKSEQERVQTAKEFYLNFTDTIVETIKLISQSEASFLKRNTADVSLLQRIIEKGKNIQLQPCHQFNVEYYNLLYSKLLPNINFVFLYMPFTTKSVDKVFQRIRSRFGSRLIAATEFRNKKSILEQKQYAITLGADQNPPVIEAAYWLSFFKKPTPFLSAPANAAIKNNLAVVFVNFKKIKRGYYHFENVLLTENASELTPQKITISYKNFVQEMIQLQPANYLWTHKRWKHSFSDAYENNKIETF
ncbi:lipid A biosynthesis protein [soil metagenome]